MPVPAKSIVGSGAAIGAILLTFAILVRWDSLPVLAAEGSSVTRGGVTLRSVNADFPDSGRLFPGGDSADAINNNCLACHSAGMILTQPRLSRAEWQAEVDKMRTIYKAPVAASDVPAIVDYLTNQSTGR